MEHDERRRTPRTRGRFISLFVGRSARGEGHIANLSRDGIFVRCDELPDPGDRVIVQIEAWDGRRLDVKGIVRWNTAQLPPDPALRPGFGVALETTSEPYEILLRHLPGRL